MDKRVVVNAHMSERMFSFSAHFHLPFVSNVSFNFFFLKYEKYLIKFRTNELRYI